MVSTAGVRWRRGALKKTLAAGVSSSVLIAGCAFAQEGASEVDDAASEFSGYETIVVTATRREESLQDIPLSVTAFGEDALDRLGVNTFADFAQRTPSLLFSNDGGPSNQTLSIRGVGVASGGQAGAGSASTVAVYFDETPVIAPFSRNASIQPPVFDLNRVEIIRGPSGTLFGASSMGGTIRYIQNKPDASGFAAKLLTEVNSVKGGGVGYGVNAMVNVPVVQDKLAARVVVTQREDAGYIDRLPESFFIDPSSAMVEGEDVNSIETTSVRASLRLTPNDRLAVTPTFYYQETDAASAGAADIAAGDFLRVSQGDEPQAAEDLYYNLLVEYDLGFADLISSTSYLDREVTRTDEAGAFLATVLNLPVSVLVGNTQGDNQNFTTNPNEVFVQEVRLQSNTDSPFQWLLGVFYFDQEGGEAQSLRAESLTGFLKFLGAIPPTAPDFLFEEDTTTTEERVAVFGEVSYTFWDQLEASVGLRWTDVSRGTQGTADGFLFGSSVTDLEQDFDSELTPRFYLAWKPDNDNLIYASAARGFRVGREQTPIVDGPCVPSLLEIGVDPNASGRVDGDNLWNYEIGAKTSFFGNRLIVNVAAFYIDWGNIQQTVNLSCGAGFVTNAGEAEIKGVELELFGKPSENFEFNFAMSFTDAESGSEGVFDIPGQDPGDRLPEVPRWVVSAGAQYTYPISDALGAYVRGDVTWRDEVFQDFAQSDAFRRPEFFLGNARVGIETGGWDAAFFVDNVFDEYIVLSIDTTGQVTRPARPRTWGVRVSREF